MSYDQRTFVEIQIHELLKAFIASFEPKKVSRVTFQRLMGMIRDAKVMLDKKETGCVNGLHIEDCTCSEGIRGRNLRHIKRG